MWLQDYIRSCVLASCGGPPWHHVFNKEHVVRGRKMQCCSRLGSLLSGTGERGIWVHLALGWHCGLDDAKAAVLRQKVGIDQVDVGGCDLLQDALDHHRSQQPRVQIICIPRSWTHQQ